MLYIYTDPADPIDGRQFLYHLPTHTLAEHFITDAGNHHLRIHQDGPPHHDAVTAFHDGIQHIAEMPVALSTMAGKVDYAALPPHIIMVSSQQPLSAIIHYPAIGFTAGIHEDGSKIPPHWRDPAIFTQDQRSHFLATAADTLMKYIAKHRNP